MKERYDSLNGLRTIACLGIVAMHVKSNILVKPTESLLTNTISYASNFVLMFMMLSALSLCCGYYERFQKNQVLLNDFFKKRYTRILPFFSLLVLIDIIVNLISTHFLIGDSNFAELWESFADVTLLFGLIPEHHISVIGVGWFLGLIFLFYMIYPFYTFLIKTKRSAWFWMFISIGLYLSVLFYFNPVKDVAFGNSSFIKCLPYFIGGGLVFLYRKDIVKSMRKMNNRVILLLVTLVYTVCFFVFPDNRFIFSDLIMYMLWLIYAIGEVSFDRKETFLNNKYTRFISDISMEIYLCHMLFFRVVEKLHLEKIIGNNDVNYCTVLVITLLGAILFSWGWKKYVESKIIAIIESI